MTEQAFEGVGILDLSEGIAGPYCTRLLGGYGADHIKVECLLIGVFIFNYIS